MKEYTVNQLKERLDDRESMLFIVKEENSSIKGNISIEFHRLNFIKGILMEEGYNFDKNKQVYIFLLLSFSMKKRGFFYLKNALILSVLLFLFLSIPPVFASQINQTLTYDGNGNLITGDGKYREYNEFNQLIRVYDGSYPNGTILESYLYHPTENRILIKYGDYGSTNPDEAVVYVNENLEKTYTTLSGTPRFNYTYYTFDENGLVGEIVKNNTNSTLRTLYYHDDYSGSVSLITNGSGGVVEQTFYEPFGAILGGGDTSRYSYEGKEFSSVTEDFDFHFRKYDPSLMIFTQPDSVIANIYNPQCLNKYSFELNNPYKYKDEDGKDSISINTGPGISRAEDDYEPSLLFIFFQIKGNEYLMASKKLEAEIEEEKNALPIGTSVIGSVNRPSREESFRRGQISNLKEYFKIEVKDNQITRYTYKGEKTTMADMSFYEGYNPRFVKNERNSQYKLITGQNYQSKSQRISNIGKSYTAHRVNRAISFWKNVKRLFGSK